jgi:hypothetical protein
LDELHDSRISEDNNMGSVTFQVIGDGAVGTKTKTYTVSDADVNRLVAFGKAIASAAGTSNPTVTQGLLAWAERTMAQVKGEVLAYEREQASVVISTITAT